MLRLLLERIANPHDVPQGCGRRMNDDNFQIDGTLLGNVDSIEARVAESPDDEREPLRSVLQYLYLPSGPASISKEHKSTAEKHLSVVERFVFQWLHKRTDGKLRRIYGQGALEAVKRCRYLCEQCGFADVRVLNIEKVANDESEENPADGKSGQTPAASASQFTCLCANCNTIAARVREMDKFSNRGRAGAARTAKTATPESDA